MIVRNGNLSMIVDDVADSIQRITGLAEDFGGYMVSSNSWKEGDRLVNEIAVRIPEEKLKSSMQAFEDLAVEVTTESTSSEDITEEYVDLQARLSNLEVVEAQLVKLMEKAEDVEAILAVQKELTNLRGQIEQTMGRMKYLERTSATSLIQVSLQQSKLEVYFIASSCRVKGGEDIAFYPQIDGGFSPYSYEWDFGDGATNTDSNPVHSYGSSGKFTITLTVMDDHGSTAEETQEGYINVLPIWSAGSVVGAAWGGLVLFRRILMNVLIWLSVFSPVWITGLVVYWLIRRRRKASRKNAT
jgi:hypothetical protein